MAIIQNNKKEKTFAQRHFPRICGLIEKLNRKSEYTRKTMDFGKEIEFSLSHSKHKVRLVAEKCLHSDSAYYVVFKIFVDQQHLASTTRKAEQGREGKHEILFLGTPENNNYQMSLALLSVDLEKGNYTVEFSKGGFGLIHAGSSNIQ